MKLQIKFSHNYPKLWEQKTATLIYCKYLHFREITKELIEYDTKTIKGDYYKLPNSSLIQLVFLGDKLVPFCTLRRYGTDKWNYYYNNIENIFDIVIEIENATNKTTINHH